MNVYYLVSHPGRLRESRPAVKKIFEQFELKVTATHFMANGPQ